MHGAADAHSAVVIHILRKWVMASFAVYYGVGVRLNEGQLRNFKQALGTLLGTDETRGRSVQLTGTVDKVVRGLHTVMREHKNRYYRELLASVGTVLERQLAAIRFALQCLMKRGVVLVKYEPRKQLSRRRNKLPSKDSAEGRHNRR